MLQCWFWEASQCAGLQNQVIDNITMDNMSVAEIEAKQLMRSTGARGERMAGIIMLTVHGHVKCASHQGQVSQLCNSNSDVSMSSSIE
jgi:hypothetical protein